MNLSMTLHSAGLAPEQLQALTLRFLERSIPWRTVLLIGAGWGLAAFMHGYIGMFTGYGLVSVFVHSLLTGAVGGLTAWLVLAQC